MIKWRVVMENVYNSPRCVLGVTAKPTTADRDGNLFCIEQLKKFIKEDLTIQKKNLHRGKMKTPCNFCLRIQRCVGIIQTFAEIERTGELPPNFRWTSIQWREGRGWMGWVVGPNGCNDLIKCRKIPDDLLIGVHTCPRLIGYLDLRDKYPEGGDDDL